MEWAAGKLRQASIQSDLGQVCQLKTLQSVQVTDNGGSIKITNGEDGVIRFATQPGHRYTITAN
jgi:hypothetical protein